MQPVSRSAAAARLRPAPDEESDAADMTDTPWESLAGTVTDTREPQELFGDETLEQALRQLTLYGPAGLPVLSEDREHLQGWITRHNVLDAVTQTVLSSEASIEHGAVAADFGADDPALAAHRPSTPLTGYEIVELTIGPDSPRSGGASTRSPGLRIASWLRSPKSTNSSRSVTTPSCTPGSA